MDSSFSRYATRPLQFTGVANVGGYRMRTYELRFEDRPLASSRFDRGFAVACDALPTPAVDGVRPGVGFVIQHQGETGDYLILCWWDNENELPTRVFVRKGEVWLPATERESFCVWDLEIFWFERQQYVATVLAGGSPDDYVGCPGLSDQNGQR